MSDVKISVKRRMKYASIPNHVIRDTRLSAEARLLLCYVMSCSDDWEFFRSQTLKVLGCGRDKYQRLVRELKGAGYLIVRPKQKPNGQLAGQEWEVFDEPQNQEEPQDEGEQNANVAQDVDSQADSDASTGSLKTRSTVTGSLKNRRAAEPADGFSGPIRKQTNKKTNITSCAPSDAHKQNSNLDEGSGEKVSKGPIERFLEIYPRVIDEQKTRMAFLDLVNAGEDPEVLVRSAQAYATEQAGNETKFIKSSDRFLREGRWRNYQIAEAASARQSATLRARADHWASSIENGRYVPTGHITGALRDEIILAGHFTDQELRERGHP